MHGARVLGWLLVEALLASAAVAAAWDDNRLTYPIKDLCRRWDHQSKFHRKELRPWRVSRLINAGAVDEQRKKLYLVGGYVLLKNHLSNSSKIGFEGEPSAFSFSPTRYKWRLIGAAGMDRRRVFGVRPHADVES